MDFTLKSRKSPTRYSLHSLVGFEACCQILKIKHGRFYIR